MKDIKPLTSHPADFKTSQEAWEKLNEGFFNQSTDYLQYRGAIRNGSELEMSDVFLHIRRAWVKPSIDFGNYFCQIECLVIRKIFF